MRVVVVGAGLAGLNAAVDLHRAGAAVTVLEARNRVGGRTYTVRDPFTAGQYADLGAELVDVGQDAMIQLCGELGIELTPEFTLMSGEIVFDGRRLSRERCDEILEEFRRARRESPPAPWEPMSAWGNRVGLSTTASQFAIAGAGMIPMTSARECDTHHFFEVPSGRRAWRIHGGSDLVSRTLAEGCEVRLEEPVRAIRQVNDSVVVATDRDTYRADHVVVAVPAPIVTELGFDPPLPEWKVRALTNLQLGSGGKVIAQYAEGDLLKERLARGCVTNGSPALIWATSMHQEGAPAVVAGLVGGDFTPALADEAAALEELDQLLGALAEQSLARGWRVSPRTGPPTSSRAAPCRRSTGTRAPRSPRWPRPSDACSSPASTRTPRGRRTWRVRSAPATASPRRSAATPVTERRRATPDEWRATTRADDQMSRSGSEMTLDVFDVTDRRVLVTGASRGIGRAVAKGLALAGAHVFAVARTGAALDELGEEIAEAGGRFGHLARDLTGEAVAVEVVAAAADALGGLDVLINNAAIDIELGAFDVSYEDFERIMEFNVNSTFALIREAGRIFVEQGHGKVVNVTSVLERGRSPGRRGLRRQQAPRCSGSRARWRWSGAGRTSRSTPWPLGSSSPR